MKCNLRSMALAVVASLSLISCSDDDSADYVTYYSARATVTSEYNQGLTLQTDGGNLLTVVSDYSGYAPQVGQRTMVTYSVESGDDNVYDANLHSACNLLTKQIVTMTANNELDMGDDPIHLYDTWCAGGYLNVNFGFNTSGNVTHYVNLIENSLVQNPGDGKIYLEFRHNAKGDSENYSKRGTVCFDLLKYKDGSNTITFVVKFTEFDGKTTYKEIKYDFTSDIIFTEEGAEIGSEYYE